MLQTNQAAKRVLVYGGTGSQGSAVAQALQHKGHQPYLLSRDGKKAKSLVDLGAKVVLGNTQDKVSLIKASEGMDAIALMTPVFTDVPPAVSAKNAIEAAQEAGVPFIVWNTSGIAPAEKTGNPLLDHQAETLQLLQESGLKYIVLAPSIYAENLLGPYTIPFVANEDKLTYPLPVDMSVNWLATQDLGKLVATAIEKPQLSGNSYQVASPERLNGRQLASAFSQGLDRKITYETMEPREFGAILNEAFGPGAGDSIAANYQQFHDFPERRAMYHIDTKAMTKDFGIALTPMSAWVTQNRNLFRKP